MGIRLARNSTQFTERTCQPCLSWCFEHISDEIPPMIHIQLSLDCHETSLRRKTRLQQCWNFRTTITTTPNRTLLSSNNRRELKTIGTENHRTFVLTTDWHQRLQNHPTVSQPVKHRKTAETNRTPSMNSSWQDLKAWGRTENHEQRSSIIPSHNL